ncbi:MAG: hypothetical protein WCT05_14655 [Lentisphaeria bacterium]
MRRHRPSPDSGYSAEPLGSAFFFLRLSGCVLHQWQQRGRFVNSTNMQGWYELLRSQGVSSSSEVDEVVNHIKSVKLFFKSVI